MARWGSSGEVKQQRWGSSGEVKQQRWSTGGAAVVGSGEVKQQ